MFSEDELKSYEQLFNQLGITSKEEQKTSAGVYVFNRCTHI